MGLASSKQSRSQDLNALILGKRGSGKSAFANFLLGEDKFQTVKGFASSGRAVNEAQFQHTLSEKNEQWNVCIMEAPGLDDLFALHRDDSRLTQIVEAINTLSSRGKSVRIDSILYVISANDPFSPEQRKLLSFLASHSKGSEKDFWSCVTVIFSNASSIADDEKKQRSAIEGERKSPHCSESFKWLMDQVEDNFLPVDSLSRSEDDRQQKIEWLIERARVSKGKHYQLKWIADRLSVSRQRTTAQNSQDRFSMRQVGSEDGQDVPTPFTSTHQIEELRRVIREQLENPENECFPEDAVVVTKQGIKYMKNLLIGDKVLCTTGKGNPIFSKVIAFLHYEPFRPAEFLRIETEDDRYSLVISKRHILLVASTQGKQLTSVLAGSINLGDSVITLSDTEHLPALSRVMKITTACQQGVYAPLTRSGTIVVNGILTSCYANVPSHRVAHAAFTPLRIISHVRFSKNSTPIKHGVHPYATLLMTWFGGEL